MNAKRIQILTDAENDLVVGRKFYDKYGKNIGDYFWDSLLSDIESLSLFAGFHRKEFGFFRLSSKRFPYVIYYDVLADLVSIVAVLPVRRNPIWIEDNISKRKS
ncbi:MAG: type II toxin-antitoxin system RelE/ParE family toxin [Methylotenera sp.]|nr:type II toxin-antitoxin system RelE/ParE family toxin [Methyloglobulus sp.]